MSTRYRERFLYGVVLSRPRKPGEWFPCRGNSIKRIPLEMGVLRPRTRFLRDRPYYYKHGGKPKPWARKYERED